MSLNISDYEKREVFSHWRKILEGLHIKTPIYNILITIGQKVALHRLTRLVEKSRPPQRKSSGKKIIFNTVHGTYLEAIYKEAGIAKALQIRGHNVKMLLCGGALDACTVLFTTNTPPNAKMCRNCNHFSKNFFEIVNLPYATYFDYLDEKDILNIKHKVNQMSLEECKNYVHKGVNVGFHAMTSTQRFYKGGDPKDSKYDYEHIFRIRLTNAIIATDVAENVLKKEKPDILVESHGCYSAFGSFSDYFKNKTIVRVWHGGYKNFKFDLHKRDEFFKIYSEKIRKKRSLDGEEEKELANFFNRRITGEEGQVSLYGFSKTKKEELEKQFTFDKYDKTYVIFPNVPWDISQVNANKGFKDVFEWLSHTIKLFKYKPSFQLIIKIHPSELKVMESKGTVLDYINSNFPSIPENIKIIPSDTTISPYSLFPFIDVGIVYNGTVGLEMSTQSIPVVVAGIAHYGNKGFTYDISTKEEYSKVLFDKTPLLPNQQTLAKVYAYFHFLKNYTHASFIYYNNFLDLGWNINSLEDLGPGKNKYLDLICNYILRDEYWQDW